MATSEFIAWSVYTGPMEIHTVIPDSACPWITGKWSSSSGQISTVSEIQADIDHRIGLILVAFKQAKNKYIADRCYFAIPEFFFRCNEGPYPNILLTYQAQQLSPFEYLKKKIEDEVSQLTSNDKRTYIICLGSVLTCNIEDYSEFFSSHPVIRRQNELNKKLAQMIKKTALVKVRSRDMYNDVEKNNPSLQKINEIMQGYRGDPLCTVRNRGIMLVLSQGEFKSYVYEKQAESTVDLTLGVFNNRQIEHGHMITEWMANCPSYSILTGDIQSNPESTNCRIVSELDNKNYGVEICLDHRLQRLRRTVDMLKINGADQDIPALDAQIVCSGGMQLLDYAIAASAGSPIFNADGCDKIYQTYGVNEHIFKDGEAGTGEGEYCGVYTLNGQSKWHGLDGVTYYSHSQLAYTQDDSKIDGYNNMLGLNNKKARTVTYNDTLSPCSTIHNYSINVESLSVDLSDRFVVKESELHYYLLDNQQK